MADDTSLKQPSPKPKDVPSTPSPALESLNALVGTWLLEGSHVQLPDTVIRGEKTYEWFEGQRFLIEHSCYDHPDIPNSIALIGVGDANAPLVQHYFDSRGVSRIYEMSLSEGIWKLWRDAPGFSQRFSGTFSDDGKTIEGLWDKSSDGVQWGRDLELTYTKVA